MKCSHCVMRLLIGVAVAICSALARKHPCFDNSTTLFAAVENAQLILTGTVVRMTVDVEKKSLLTGVVRVKRVIKGSHLIGDQRQLTVFGFGDPAICESFAHKSDTKIFLLSQRNESFYLNSSLVPITLKNLDVVNAAITGRPFRRRKPITPTTCETKQCGYGAVCIVHPNSINAECECRTDCDRTLGSEPVCGTDNVVYPSECHLAARSCQQHIDIRVQAKEHCNKRNPCDELRCLAGERCVPSFDGLSAQCVCPSRCDNYGDTTDSKPVCGSDGRDYESLCELQRTACTTRTNITMKFYGRCDPCTEIRCPAGTACKLGPHRRPECRCSEQCALTESPVCASDGKTYQNECIMKVSGCRSGVELRVFLNGRCEEAINPCLAKKCSHDEQCFINMYGKATCECAHICEAVMRPVCGLDGETYDNECELRRRACVTKVRNEVKHLGTCGYGICATYSQCRSPKVCVVREGQPTCACPVCNDDLKEVCGSDGITYANACKLKQEACRIDKDIYQKYEGPCDGCADVECDYYAVCVTDGKGNGECQCPRVEDCPQLDKPVCGTDGQTYNNLCQLKVSACHSQRFVMSASEGACDSCADVRCPWGQRCQDGRCSCPTMCPHPSPDDRVCGSDGQIYSSECYMQLASCHKGMALNVQPMNFCSESAIVPQTDQDALLPHCTPNSCQFGGFCLDLNGDGRDECACEFNCTGVANSSICATDGLIYRHHCDMDLASCRMQQPLYERPLIHACYYSDECQCNRVGAFDNKCDPLGRCNCRPGVSGAKCDHCLPGFWGIHLIARGKSGCQPCGCSAFGSSRTDCEQTTGRCMCLPNASGMKCDSCPAGNYIMSPNGCVTKEEYLAPRSCEQMKCHHEGKCIISKNGKPDCECPRNCGDLNLGLISNMTICGSDGQTYADMCQLVRNACRYQIDLVPVALGSCTDGAAQKGRSLSLPRGEREDEEESKGAERAQTDLDRSNEVAPTEQTRKLGTSCRTDADCRIPNSVCTDHLSNKICVCKRNFVLSSNGNVCQEFHPGNSLVDPCEARPCFNNAHCQSNASSAHGFMCLCREGFAGILCEQNRTADAFNVPPYFNGSSLHEFSPIKGGSSKMSIRLEFKPTFDAGVLLFNGQEMGKSGDFISLSLSDGFVHFRFDLGDGPIGLRSTEAVSLGKWHVVEASRKGQQAQMTVDGVGAIESTRPQRGANQHLNLMGALYLGGTVAQMAQSVHKAAQAVGNYSGCIRSLQINEKAYDLQIASRDSKLGINIGQCGADPCSNAPCMNNGRCSAGLDKAFKCNCATGYEGVLCERLIDVCATNPCLFGGMCTQTGGSFVCACPSGRTGKTCEKDLLNNNDEEAAMTALFEGDGCVRLAPFRADVDVTFNADVWLKPSSPNGIVFYWGHSDPAGRYVNGDFVALVLVNFVPHFFWNVGSGVSSVSASSPLDENTWSSVKFGRHLRNGSVGINDGPVVRSLSPPNRSHLNLGSFSAYLGGVPNFAALPPIAKFNNSFSGGIQQLTINGAAVNIKTAERIGAVKEYNGPPCTDDLCLNGAKCEPILNDFRCRCSTGYAGKHCENRLQSDVATNPSIKLDGSTAQSYRNKITKSVTGQQSNKLTLEIRTTERNGLIWWENKGATLYGDYLAIALIDGRISLTFNLGTEKEVIQTLSRKSVSDGAWHKIVIQREKREAMLMIDGDEPVSHLSSPGSTELNTDGIVWIGGKDGLPIGLPAAFYQRFVGCLQNVQIDGMDLNLIHHALGLHRPSLCR